MDNLTTDEKQAIAALLRTSIVQNEMGAENWDLTEEQEELLWGVIDRLSQESNSPVIQTPPVLLNLGDAPPWVKAFELEHGMKPRRQQEDSK